MSNYAVDVYYLTIPVDNADQANSLSSYLSAHGIDASAGGADEVVIACDKASLIRKSSKVRSLHSSWKDFWEHSDSELYGLPVYSKPPVDCEQGCTT